jgi:DEAD/DEAH box helicase domain-containing protein
LPAERREIEQGLRKGNVRAVVATTALELGIDIGGMGAALMVGYPGSIAATWQQAGRAGRADEQALVVLVATAAPLDQFLADNPDYLFKRSPEHALINPDNLLILLDHLRCAAFELPFNRGERFGDLEADLLVEFLEFLQQDGVLHHSGDTYFWMADAYPAQGISLRSASTKQVILQAWDQGRPEVVGQVDQASAFWMVHPEAIYMHQGQTYLVEDLDIDGQIAHLQAIESDYYTEPRRKINVELVEQFEEDSVKGAIKAYGEIVVTSQVTGFYRVRWYTHERLGMGELDMPPTQLLTSGYWLALTEDTVSQLNDQGLWRDAPIDYGPNWNRQRKLARARDNYRCQVCGAPESGREHDVHHKTPFRSYTVPQIANELANLITLCPVCHRRAESAVRVRSGLSGLAFVLSHLSPFFLMCDVTDLGVHADPNSPIAGGRPVVVLYDQIPAGIGLSQRLYEIHGEIMQRADQLVKACECQDGCPSCVGPGGENGLGAKNQTLAILNALTDYSFLKDG